MFIYETTHTVSDVAYKALAVCFKEDQLPTDDPDIVIWRDDSKAYVKIGDNTIEGVLD